MINLNKLSTEKNNPNSKNIELQENYEILKRINEEDKKVAFCVEKKLGDISKLMDAIVENYKENTRIIYMGAGTSGRLGILDASECPPTYGVSPELVQGLIAGGKEAVFLSQENAEDNKEQGKKDLMEWMIFRNEFLPLMIIRRYLKLVYKYSNENNLLDKTVSELEKVELPFKIQYLPTEFPKPKFLKLNITVKENV